jgi:hypothetical protein
MNQHVEKIKKHLQENKTVYIAGAGCLVVAGITFLIMRSSSGSTILRDSIVEAQRDSIVLGKNATLNQVSYFASERQGPPSWVVRCIETGNVFTSQRSAAFAMEISESNISRQLNGLKDQADGYHFERLCMAA